MALTTSLYTGLTGLDTSSRMLDVTGNNIANINTVGFKGSNISFESAIVQNLGSASAPTANSGGTNPTQVGMGAQVAAITRDFSDGSLHPTGVNTNMAVQGNGFFIVNQNGNQRYTRAGNFSLDSNYNLVMPNGAKVMGYGVDKNGNVVSGVLQPINIPLGNMTLAKATTDVQFTGNLNASGTVATQGSITTSGPLYSNAAATTPATAATALTGLYDASGNQLFSTGDVVTLSGITKGGAKLPDKTFQVGATNTTASDGNGTTLQDFMTFLQDTTGIDTSVGGGISVNSSGQLVVTSNTGTVNGIGLTGADVVDNASSASPTQPFTFTDTQNANGESARTTFVAYDSLGNQMNVNLNMVFQSKNTTGTTWRYYVQSADNSGLNRALGTGTVSFDSSGKLISTKNPTFSIDRTGTGAQSPQQITLEFNSDSGSLSALSDQQSQLATVSQDGAPIGSLDSFSVNNDGTIVGVFSNSLHQNLGQVALAKFSNPDGLVQSGQNLFSTSSNSGTAQVGTATQAGLGKIVGGAVEQSNVDLSAQFVNLISASTGFSANSRVITTNQKLMQDLLAAIQ